MFQASLLMAGPGGSLAHQEAVCQALLKEGGIVQHGFSDLLKGKISFYQIHPL